MQVDYAKLSIVEREDEMLKTAIKLKCFLNNGVEFVSEKRLIDFFKNPEKVDQRMQSYMNGLHDLVNHLLQLQARKKIPLMRGFSPIKIEDDKLKNLVIGGKYE